MNKEQYCRRIMDVYGVIVDFDGVPGRKNVPGPIGENETLKAWSERVLGSDATAITFNLQHTYAPQTRMSTIKNDSRAAVQQTKKVVKSAVVAKQKKAQKQHDDEIKAIFEKYKIAQRHNNDIMRVDTEEVYGLIQDITLKPTTLELMNSLFKNYEGEPVKLILQLISTLDHRITH
ncbi:hypothetical protein [Pseudoalteromonas pernae]|uniref:hypothetical protein n=1 Tax=Pseudoalteromonas pernae TaxID=3118054 RepID=UPI003242562D